MTTTKNNNQQAKQFISSILADLSANSDWKFKLQGWQKPDEVDETWYSFSIKMTKRQQQHNMCVNDINLDKLMKSDELKEDTSNKIKNCLTSFCQFCELDKNMEIELE